LSAVTPRIPGTPQNSRHMS